MHWLDTWGIFRIFIGNLHKNSSISEKSKVFYSIQQLLELVTVLSFSLTIATETRQYVKHINTYMLLLCVVNFSRFPSALAVSGTMSTMFLDGMTQESEWFLKCRGVYSAQIQPNTTKLLVQQSKWLMAKHILQRQPKKEEDKDRYSSLVKSVTKSASFAVSERPTNIFITMVLIN